MPDALHDAVTSLSASVDKIVNTVDTLLPAMNRLSESSEHLAKKNMRWKALVISIAVLFLGVLGLVWQVHRQSSCITSWANESTARSNLIGPLNILVLSDLGLVLDDVFAVPTDQKKTTKDARQLDTDLHTYRAAAIAHPVPNSPKFSCSVFTL